MFRVRNIRPFKNVVNPCLDKIREMRPWLVFACSAVVVGCGAFGSSPSADDAGSSDASDDASADAAAADGGIAKDDGGSEGGVCGATRAQALRCGTTETCPRANGGACCADGASTRYCGSDSKPCSGTQMNCQGNADCAEGETCCQLGSFIGSACRASCEGKPHYC